MEFDRPDGRIVLVTMPEFSNWVRNALSSWPELLLEWEETPAPDHRFLLLTLAAAGGVS